MYILNEIWVFKLTYRVYFLQTQRWRDEAALKSCTYEILYTVLYAYGLNIYSIIYTVYTYCTYIIHETHSISTPEQSPEPSPRLSGRRYSHACKVSVCMRLFLFMLFYAAFCFFCHHIRFCASTSWLFPPKIFSRKYSNASSNDRYGQGC